jgi:NAD(P)-dependent dehydrogenase (short-subunit alcohol dehydrogenase family)
MKTDLLFSLAGKSILLTGGSCGIGAAMASGLEKHGASVGVFDKVIPDNRLENIKYYSLDIARQEEVLSGFKLFLDDFKGIDVLVNNAGMTFPCQSEDYPLDKWEQTLSINLTATFSLCQLAGREMIKQKRGGSIINITSIGAVQGFPNNPAYVATKGAVRQLTKGLAYDWGKYNIRVNNLAPGYTHTPMNRKSWDDPALRAERAGRTFLGRWAEPEDMIGPVVFLASDASSYVTGTDLHVDGGWSAKGI